MKIKNLAIFAIMAMAALASCKKPSVDPTPKPDPDPDPDPTPVVVVEDVFFSAENGDYCFYVGASDAKKAVVSVVRAEAKEAASFGIKVNSASEGVVVPESVSFKANENTATLEIAIPESAQVGEVYDFDISLKGENVNPSASSELGTLRCEGSVYLYRAVTLASRFGKTDESIFAYFGYFRQNVWILDSKTVILKSFMGSDHDVTIRADENANIISITSNQYDLYTMDDGYGGTAYWFCHPIEGSEDWFYDTFYPKGNEQREIYGFALDDSAGYGLLQFNDAGQLRLRLFSYEAQLYSEVDAFDKSFYWQYMYLWEYDDAAMAEFDFETYPELSKYPEAEEITDSEGPVLEFYLGGVRLDDQKATLVNNEDGSVSYVVDNLWWSDCTVTFTVTDGVLSLAAVDNSGDEPVDALYTSGYYTDFYSSDYIWFWPWNSDYYQGFTKLTYYNDASYCTFDTEAGEGSLYVYWNFWAGEDYTLGSDQDDYLDIYVK